MVKHEDKTSVCFGEVSAPFSVLSCFGNVTGHRLHATKKKKKFFEKKKKKNGHQKCLLSVAGFVSENEQTGSDWQMFPVNPESLRYCRE